MNHMNPVLKYTVCCPRVQLLSIPTDYSCDEQRDGSDVTFVPHILNVCSHTLTPGHCAYKESLGEENRIIRLKLFWVMHLCCYINTVPCLK